MILVVKHAVVAINVPPRKRSGSRTKVCKKRTVVWKCENCGKVAQMNEWFETEWAGVAQVFRLRRSVKDTEKEREEIASGLTHLTRKQANAARLLAEHLAHWRIENRLHRRRDVTDGGKMLARSVLAGLPKLWLPLMAGSSL